MKAVLGLLAAIAVTAAVSACALWPSDTDATAPASASSPPPSRVPARTVLPTPPAFPALSPAALAAHTQFLASDALEGRKPASATEAQTLDYIAGQFAAAGLKPGYQGTFLQPVAMVETEVEGAPVLSLPAPSAPPSPSPSPTPAPSVSPPASPSSALAASPASGPSGPAIGLLSGFDHRVWTRRQDQAAPIVIAGAPLVFVGYGVNAPEQNWNDYSGADLRGAIAVILINDPDFESDLGGAFGGKAMTYYGRWTYKFEEAARQGALGALLVHETDAAGYPWSVVQSSWTGPLLTLAARPGAPQPLALEGWVTRAGLERALTAHGVSFADLKAQAGRRGFKSVVLPAQAHLTLSVRQRSVISYNVVGVLPGRQRPDESVVYGAHWDHLGRCPPVNGDDICNGARDNAVGVAGVIEIARRFVQDGRAERSVVFIAFTAEEQGLLGSRAYAEAPAFAHARTAAMINIDAPPVIGPSKAMTIVGAGRSDLDLRLERVLAPTGRRIEAESFPERGGFFRSDHFSFARFGVPVLFASGGVDLVHGGVARGLALQNDYVARAYHKPDDEFDPATWDLTGVSQDVTALYQVGRRLADSRDWPQWAPASEFKPIRDASRAGMN
jgi:Zn-dependent M28 family amino/carboxypeptidase